MQQILRQMFAWQWMISRFSVNSSVAFKSPLCFYDGGNWIFHAKLKCSHLFMSYKHLNFCENIFKSRVIIKFAELTSTFLLLRLNGIKIIKWQQMNSWEDYLWNTFQQLLNLKSCRGVVLENITSKCKWSWNKKIDVICFDFYINFLIKCFYITMSLCLCKLRYCSN